ncbi:MAG: L-seryl-tRNA(Sec) selenium transferase, partial [Janthinobacterium lividum]
MDDQVNRLYRELPSVGDVLSGEETATLLTQFSRELVTDAARKVLARLREQVRAGAHDEVSIQAAVAGIFAALQQELSFLTRPSLRRVINATGVILQTNLGRAPLSEAALAAIVDVARGYCNVELDLATGERSRRDVHVETLILNVLSTRLGKSIESLQERYAAAVVNNCAAATFLGLNTMAERGEVIVSRGELVEIGGGFRIPDILRKSGAILREVGTTNRTRIADYEAAITPETRLILRVHQSNFRIEGFTERPALAELKELSIRTSIPIFDDQGTGCLVSLDEYGIRDEAAWTESLRVGPDLV